MHFRMCWFRNRWRFAAYLIASLALTTLTTLPAVLRYENSRWSLELVSARQAAFVWEEGVMFIGLALMFPLLIMAADYGAHALGDSRREASGSARQLAAVCARQKRQRVRGQGGATRRQGLAPAQIGKSRRQGGRGG